MDSKSYSGTTNIRGQRSWSVKAIAGPQQYVARVAEVAAGSMSHDPGMNTVGSVSIVVS